MRCALVRWWMEEYIDGRLDGWRLRWVQKHLQACQACAQELSWRRSLASTLKLTVSAPSSQEMWQEFQQRLAQRTPPARTLHVPWWQVGTATAVVACALLLGVVWWARHPAPVQTAYAPDTLPQTAPQRGGAASTGDLSSRQQHIQQESQPLRTVKAPAKNQRAVPSPPPSKTPAYALSAPAPQEGVSVAYAEVRNASGELVGKVLLQTTYDATGQPKAVRIEMDQSAVVEVETDEQPMDRPDSHSDTSGSADGTVPAVSTFTGVSD